jgi:Phosphatidylinositol-glycan biosynthesis class S protein
MSPTSSSSRSFQAESKRLWILGSFVLTILLAAPVWWKTTSIERLSLPRSQLKAWREAQNSAQCPFELPVQLRLTIDSSLYEHTLPPAEPGNAERNAERAEQTLAFLSEVTSTSAALLNDNVAALLDPSASAACIKFRVGLHESKEEETRMVLEIRRLERWYAAKDEAEQKRQEHKEKRELKRQQRRQEEEEWRAQLASATEGETDVEEANRRAEMRAQEEELDKREEEAELEAALAIAQPPAHLIAPRQAPGSTSPDSKQSILGYRIHLADSDAQVVDTLGRDLQFQASAGNPTSAQLAQRVVTESTRAFPLACLASNGRASECPRPAGVTSSKAIQYKRNVELVLSLVHEDASNGGAYTGWRVSSRLRNDSGSVEALSSTLASLSNSGIHNFKVESQMLFYAPLAFEPRRKVTSTPHTNYIQREVEVDVEEEEEEGEEQAEVEELLKEKPKRFRKEKRVIMHEMTINTESRKYLIDFEDLKVFVNAGEWNLGASTPQTPQQIRDESSVAGQADDVVEAGEEPRTLHFVLYVPARNHAPLQIRDPSTGEASSSKSWIVPQWGGVVILDRPSPGTTAGQKDLSGDLPEEALQEAMKLWDTQLRALLGVPQSTTSLSQEQPVSVLEADLLALTRINENIQNSIDTLDSIVSLVDKLRNLGVDKEVKADFMKSLASLDKVSRSCRVLQESNLTNLIPFSSHKVPSTRQKAH